MQSTSPRGMATCAANGLKDRINMKSRNLSISHSLMRHGSRKPSGHPVDPMMSAGPQQRVGFFVGGTA